MATICLMIANKDELALLRGLLAKRYATVSVHDVLPDTPYDLFITDATMLDKFYSRLLRVKQSIAPVLLPILLITTKREIDLFHDVWQTIDEIITAPVEITELLGRIGILLRMRKQSLQLQSSLEEIKLANYELHASEARFRAIYESNMVGMFFWTLDGSITEANGTFLQMVGYTRDDLLQHKIRWDALTPPELRWKDLRALEEMAGKIRHNPYEKEFIHKDGTRVPVITAGAKLGEKSPEGVSFILDITDRKNAEDALKRSEEKWNLGLENINAGVIIAAESEEIIYWNPAAEAMYGIKSEKEYIVSLEKASLTFELWTYDNSRLLEFDEWPMRRIKRGEKVNNLELKIHRPDQGWEKFFSYSGTMVETTQGARLIYLTVIDQTDLRKAEQESKRYQQQLHQRTEDLTKAVKELESFSYSVAHDLRNPLITIKGFISILLEDCSDHLDDECKDYVSRISISADRINSIIDDILALSKISRQEMSIDTVNLSEMARLAIQELQASQPHRRMEVIIEDGLIVSADARLVSVAVGNLIGNAWKYTGKSAHPRIEFGSFWKDGSRVFFVKDNGAGFDMNQAELLFQPFKRLHSDKEFSGTGVGLAIVERAISHHGGKVWAEGEPGKGAAFYFTLG